MKFEFEAENIGNISDGYHTFDELYYHRMILFATICNQNKEKSWKSKKHDDGTMYDGYFIVGIDTPQGQYTYHCKLSYWDKFDVKKLDFAKKYDGHMPNDVDRLLSLDNRYYKMYSIYTNCMEIGADVPQTVLDYFGKKFEDDCKVDPNGVLIEYLNN